MSPDALNQILADNFAAWVRDLGIVVTDVTEDGAITRMPLGDHIARVGGIVSGQALAALADTSIVLAAIAQAGELRLYATTDLATQFLRPGAGTAILCRSIILRQGRALCYARAEMTEETSGKLIACATATLYAAP